MVNEFMRRRRSGKFFHSVSVVDRINSAALSFVEEANQEYKGARVITKGMTLEVVRRSLADNAGETFSVKRHRALADVSQFVALAHKNKIVASVSKNHDLLPISHPESARAHSFSADSLDRARALWVADDPIIKDEETRSFVVTALCASIDSPEAQYAVARLKSLPPGEIPPVVLFAISEDEPLEPLLAFSIPGINVKRRIRKGIFRMGNSRAARSARARAQRRDRKGRFAWMGAGLLFLLRGRGGSVSRKRGRVVGQSPTSNTFDVEFPDGQLVRVPADKAEAVKAVLGEDLTKGKGSAPVSVSAADKVVSPAEMESIEAPSGFSKDTSWSPDEDSVSYYGRNTDNGTLYTDDAYDVLQFKTGNAQAKDRFEIAQQKQAEGQDIVVLGAGKDGAIDDTKPVYFIQRRDGKGGIFGVTQSWADVQRFISQDQKLFEKDKPVDPSGLEKWEADNPEGESIADLPDADGPEDTEDPEPATETEDGESSQETAGLKPSITSEEIQSIKEQSIEDYVAEQGRVPIPRGTLLNYQGDTSDVAQAAKRDYQKVYDLLKERDPEFAEKYPEYEEFWDRVKSLAVDNKYRAYDSEDEIPEETKQYNRAYAEAVLGMEPDGELTLYRNVINNPATMQQAGTGYWSTDRDFAQDYGSGPENVEKSKEEGSLNGFYEGKFRPDQINGMLGYSQVEDEFAVVISPDSAGEEGRVTRLGPLTPVALPDFIDEKKIKYAEEMKGTGGTPFRFFSLSGLFNLKTVDRNPMGEGNAADFFEANGIDGEEWARRYDAMWGEGAYAESKEVNTSPSFQQLQKFFVQDKDGNWYVDLSKIDTGGADAPLTRPYYGEGRPDEFKFDRTDSALKSLLLVQEITGLDYMSIRKYEAPGGVPGDAPEPVADLPEAGRPEDTEAPEATPDTAEEAPEESDAAAPEWTDRFGRSIPIGRPVNFKVNHPKKGDVDVYGEFAGDSGKDGVGLVRVEGDPNLPDGLYEVSSENGAEYLPSYKPEYLESVGIKQGFNEAGEAVPARTAAQIPAVDEIVRRDLEDVDESKRPEFDGWEKTSFSKEIDEYVESRRDSILAYEREKTQLWNESQEPGYERGSAFDYPPESEPLGTPEERTEAALNDLRQDLLKFYEEDNYVYSKGDNQIIVNKRLAQRDPEYVEEIVETASVLVENEPVTGGVSTYIQPRLSARVNFDGVINTFAGGTALRGRSGIFGRPTTINMHYRNALNFRGLDNPLDVLGERVYVPFGYEGADGEGSRKNARGTFAHEWGHARDFNFGEGGGLYTKEMKGLVESDPSTLDGLGWYGRTNISESVAEYYSQYVGEKYFGAEPMGMPQAVIDLFEADNPPLPEGDSFNLSGFKENTKYTLPENDTYNSDGSRKEGVEDKFARPAGGGDAPPFKLAEPRALEPGESPLSEDFIDFGPEPAFAEVKDFLDKPLKSLTDEELSLVARFKKNYTVSLDEKSEFEFVMDEVRRRRGEDTPAEPEEVKPAPDGMYTVDRGQFVPQGAQDGVESGDYTDDPVELAQRFSSEELREALAEAATNGSGEALLPFDEGDEYVPAEALFNALKEQGEDADQILDDIYEGKDGDEAPEEFPEPEAREGEVSGPLTLEEISENREEINEMLPELLRGLTDEEVAQVFEDEDYSQYLPENEEFDVPEGMYELDSNPFPVNQDFAPEDAPEGSPTSPIDLASDMSSEDLEDMLRRAITGETDRLGYAGVVMPDDDGEDFEYDVPAEAIRDALQLQGLDTNEILRETYDNNEPTPEEVEDMFDGEDVEETEDGGEPGEPAGDGDAGGPEGSGEDVSEPEADGPGDSDGESPWSSLDNPVTEAARAEVLRERGYPTPEIFELDSEQDAEAFVQMMEGLKEGNPYASSVYIYDVEEYREMRLFSTADGKAGFGIKPNGDIVSVYIYSDSDHRKGTLSMLAQAVELGGDRLDAYDTVLPKIYAQAGFKPVSRVRWNTDFEPDGWDPELYAEFNNGQPDVVAMAYDPDRVDSEYDSSEGEYFDDYDAAMAARDASIDGEPAETAEAAEPVEASDFNQIYDTSGWTQVGGQGGSNEGGFFEDPQGNEYYVKIPKSEDHARNEVAASALYEAAGLDVGRVYFGRNEDGDLVLVSPIISAVDGELGEFINDEGVPESAWGGFAVDAWLNNWDAVGLTYDNMLVKDGKVFRIDPGGSLFYRAQGAEKGLPDDVTLIESLRNPDVNQQSARVFGGMTDEDVRDSVRKLEALTPERISEVVDEIYADDPDRGNEIKEKLLARREWLIENYGSADAAQPEETVEPEEPGSVDRLILDFDSDIEEQISTAVSEGRRLVFSYDGVDRDVTPIGELEFNEKTGNTNVLTVDSEGNYKKFTLSKMKPAENASALDEADTPGEDIPVNDAGIPEKQLKESAKQVDALVDTIFNTDDITSTDIENYGEGDGVDDDLTDSVIEAVDGLPEAPDADAPATLEEQVLADAIESAFEGDVDDVPSSVDELIQASEAIDGGFVKPDIIWQEILDTYNGKKLDNGHIVVSSTMHGDRRYDVLVRRANNNTFHIYHRITSPDGSTKVREMGKKGWHSTKALFGKIDAQIDNSRNSPKTTVDKHLTSENIKTLYSDSSTPKQPDSYVDANGNTIKPGDRIVVVNETHSKFGVGARVVSKTELFAGGDSKESEKYLYTDYVRVQYDDDGSYNWIVSQSTALEGTEGTSAGPTEAPATSSVPSNPESSLSAFSSGQTLTYAQAETLPKGAVVSLEDGTLIRKGASGLWIVHLDGLGMPAFFAEGMEAKFQSYDPYFQKTPPKKLDPLKGPPPPPPGSSKPEAEKAAEPELPQGKPLSGMKYAKSPSAPKFYDEDSANVGVMQSNLNTLGSGKAFANEYEGSGNRAQMEEFFQAAFADAPENQLPSIPRDKNGQMLVPGAVVNVGEGFDTFAIVTEIQDYYYPDDSSSSGTGAVDIVIINGAEKGSEYVSVDASELTGNSTFISTQQAKDIFNVEIDDKFRNTLREGKQALYSPNVYKNEDMVAGPGFEEPELESLPSWGNSVEGVKTVEDIMKDLRNFGVTGRDAGDGYYTLIDSSAIEDGQVRFQRVVNENGEVEIRMTGKLTHWAGNDTQKKLSEDGKGPESGNGSAGIKLEGFTYDDEGNLVSRGDTAQYLVDSQERGTTYIGEYGRARINFFRAMSESTDNSLSDEEKKVDFFADPRYTSNPVTFHNMFDIRLPENASQGDIERALQELGVASARPATDVDVRNIAENKLLWLFGSLTDGTRNPSSVLRQQELQKIKQEWGVTADDIVVETDGTTQQRPVFLMPQAIADKIAQRTGVDVMHHNLHITASNKQDVVDTVVKIIMSGRLESTLGRHISGDFGSGKSSSEDVNGPGANYSFFYMNKDFSQDAGGMTGQVNFVFDARTLLRRFDFYANTADGWGGLYGADVDVIGNMSNRQSNAEILFKHNVSLENLMGVAMTDEVREAVLEELRAMGIDYLGDASIENIFDHDVDQYL